MQINTDKPYRIFAEVLEQEALNQFESAMQQPFVVRGALMPASKGESDGFFLDRSGDSGRDSSDSRSNRVGCVQRQPAPDDRDKEG